METTKTLQEKKKNKVKHNPSSGLLVNLGIPRSLKYLALCGRSHVIEFRPGGDLALQQGDILDFILYILSYFILFYFCDVT